ncbi:GNAT family N-acetyltransferase [Paracoccus alkanivorans]|uniref:GNAT family N-acetyltransferase n=2 Tax=Paracoccus alkanivorans TaxID=2116655 RepID=A0A3M0M2J8_9RHOB|nr:GNAT family N-acetyltransferase [Paracoccus alkanivorans]
MQTLFVLDNGRIRRENDPDRSAGPRFWLAGCRSGNIVSIGAEVNDDVAAEVASIAKLEVPFGDVGGRLRYHERYNALLCPATVEYGLVYRLPHSLPLASSAVLIESESERGKGLYEDLAVNGMPQGMIDLGFRRASDLWPPWCAVMVNDEVASIAFAARISEVGAELGLATAKAYRGRGLALAAVAAWSSLAPLQKRHLFYSTDRSNTSSRKVASKLGLPFVGNSVRFI